jgi:hypothetical protein
VPFVPQPGLVPAFELRGAIMQMQTKLPSLARVALVASLLGCGAPATQKAQEKLTAPLGDVSGCDQFGFAGTQAITQWSVNCGIPGSNIVNADGDPTGQELRMIAYFNCRTYDQDTWDEAMEWDTCLNGHQHPSDGDASISYDYPGCHYVDGVCGFAQLPDNPLEVDGTTPDGMLLRSLIANLNDARAKLKAQGDTGTLTQSLQILDAAQLFADLSDEAFVRKARALGVQSVSVGMRLVDLAVNFTPGVALGRDSVIVLTGTNPVTGEKISDTERAMIAGTLLVPAFLEGAAHTLVDLGESLEGVARSAKAEAGAAGDLAAAIERSDEEVMDLVHAVPCTSSRRAGSVSPLASTPCRAVGELTAELASQSEAVLDSLREGEVSFGKAVRADYNTTFFDSYGWELKEEVGQVHHAVEQQVLTRYPGVVTADELNSLENLRGIPLGPDGYELHQSDIRRYWDAFYDSFDEAGRVPTKEDLLSMAKQIDDMFGRDFIPAIR